MLLNALSGDVARCRPSPSASPARASACAASSERGWVEETGDGTWVLTDEGRAAKERLGTIVDGIRSRVAGAVSPEDFATTIASLEAIARELGWEESARMPRGLRSRPGFGRGFRPGSAPVSAGASVPVSDPAQAGASVPVPVSDPVSVPASARTMTTMRTARATAPTARTPATRTPSTARTTTVSTARTTTTVTADAVSARCRSAQRAYERGFDAGYSRGRSAEHTTSGATDAVDTMRHGL